MAKYLLPLLLFFGLSSCDYSAESLPNHLVADYEFAFPIADTVITISDFFQFSSVPPFEIGLPKGTSVRIMIEYPFYLADLSEKNYVIQWIDPKAILGNEFTESLEVMLSCYISTLSLQQYVLANEQLLSAGENTLFADKRIYANDFPITESNKLHIIVDFKTKENTSVQKLLDGKLQINFGLKVALQINHTL